MKKIGEYLVCHKQTCKILAIKDNYYILEPLDDPSLKMKIPTDSKVLRELIKKEDINKLLKSIPAINTIDSSDRLIENTYKELMKRGTYEDLITVIKTTYLRNLNRKNNNKKISDKDNSYFLQAEKYLYTELGVVLNLDFESTKKYVIDTVSKYN